MVVATVQTMVVEFRGVPIECEAMTLPSGSVVPVPGSRAKEDMKSIEHPCGWKNPTAVYMTTDVTRAYELAFCLVHYMGGADIRVMHDTRTDVETLYVSSLGYYFHIGA